MTGAGRRRGAGDPSQDRPRLALPGDLAGSLRHLDDAQLDALLRAANAEAERRGWKTRRAAPRGSRRDAAGAPPRASARVRTESELTPGQEKIVRAALAAGVGPAAIAREFPPETGRASPCLATWRARCAFSRTPSSTRCCARRTPRRRGAAGKPR